MKRIAPIQFRFVYEETGESKRRVGLAYTRIFELARRKMALDFQSTREYTGSNGEQRRVSDTGGSGGEVKGKENHHLPDVQSRQDSGSEVWEGVADQQQVTYRTVSRKGDLS